MDQYFREPFSAAVIAAAAVMAYIFATSKMNGKEKVKNSDYIKPAFLVGLLVYFIVGQAKGSHEAPLREPF
jgi:multisubunit Na+/H+ antiporter MnhB subunit